MLFEPVKKDHGLVLNPNSDVRKVDTYLDVDFDGCMDTSNILILHMLRVVPYLSSRFLIVLFCGFQSYRLRLLSRL